MLAVFAAIVFTGVGGGAPTAVKWEGGKLPPLSPGFRVPPFLND